MREGISHGSLSPSHPGPHSRYSGLFEWTVAKVEEEESGDKYETLTSALSGNNLHTNSETVFKSLAPHSLPTL